jgi:hypothetical protein
MLLFPFVAASFCLRGALFLKNEQEQYAQEIIYCGMANFQIACL